MTTGGAGGLRKAPKRGQCDGCEQMQIRISKHPALAGKQYRMTKIQITKTLSVQFLLRS